MNMNMRPLVSVIMPCYNHEKYVAQSIESVLNQTYDNIELVVLDNGSTDGSYDVIKQYKDRITHLLHVDENNILESGRRMLAVCEGEYIAFCTSDDLWEPQKIEKQIYEMQLDENIQACFTWVNLMDENGYIGENAWKNVFMQENKTRYEWIERLFIKGNCLGFPSAVVKRDICEQIFANVSPLRQIQDMEMWIQILINGGDIYVVQEALTSFRIHALGDNQNMSAATIENTIRGINENIYMLFHYVRIMDNEVFVKSFNKYLQNPEACGELEVQCEKFLFLKMLADSNKELAQIVMLYYYELDKTTLNFLREKYGFSFDDFCKFSGMTGAGAADQNINTLGEMQTFLRQHRKILSEFYSLQGDGDDNEDIVSYYRKQMGTVLTWLQKEYQSYICDSTKFLMDYLEKANDEQFLRDYDEILNELYSMETAWDFLWDEFMLYDPELDNGEYTRFKQGIKDCRDNPEIFSSDVLPFILKGYVILNEYKE